MRTSYTRTIFWRMLVVVAVIGTASASIAEDKLNISGYGNAHTMDHNGLPKLDGKDDPNELFFQIREFSLFFDFAVSEGVIASLEMEAGNNGSTFTPNYAYIEIDFPSIVDTWDEDLLGGLSLRIGKILVPFLSYNENKPNFKQNLMSQPFTAWNVAPVIPSPPDFTGLGWSDVGAVLNWNHEVGDAGLVDLKLALIGGIQSETNILDDNTITLDDGMMMPTVRPRDGLVTNNPNNARDNNQDKATVVKLTVISSDVPLDIGVSWYSGAWDQNGQKDLEMQGIHLNWLERNWTLKGEWVVASVEQDAGIDLVGNPMTAAINTSSGDYDMNAWYLEGSFIPYRYGANETLFYRLVARYDDVDTNDAVNFTPFDRSRITIGSEWQFSSKARFRYEWQRHELHDFDQAPMAFKTAGGKEHVKMHMVSVIFWF